VVFHSNLRQIGDIDILTAPRPNLMLPHIFKNNTEIDMPVKAIIAEGIWQ
tara:strand:+ start:191 stop:340 length:150 start_codon:yes stop_codon:yes gene_type:complete